MDHFAQKKDAPLGMGGQRLVGDFHRVLNAEAEPEVTGQNETHRTEVEQAGAQVLLARILLLARLFDPRDDRAGIKIRDVKLSGHGTGRSLCRLATARC